MSQAKPTVSPDEAWERLPETVFREGHARHLLRRIGYASTPRAVREAVRRGLGATLRHYFGQVRAFAEPEPVTRLRNSEVAFRQRLRDAGPLERRRLYRERREENAEAYRETFIAWLQFAADPENAPQEKFVSFLQNVLVVSYEKVKDMVAVTEHQDLPRRGISGHYPELVKAVSRSAAMIHYLDLQRSSKDAPNENFARELFELFVLGVGNYTEQDIKEAARAFTGYRHGPRGFWLARGVADNGAKTVFGETGNFDGDAIVELAFRQPAAKTYLPREFVRTYVHEDGLPEPYIESLGEVWARTGFRVSALPEVVFNSILFYEEGFRGNVIKTPTHFYLGLCQDLQLDVVPLPRYLLPSLRAMGQLWYQPPNVRGWVGGKLWITASTLAARRALVQRLFEPLREEQLNADERKALEEARGNGYEHFVVSEERLMGLTPMSPRQAAEHLCRYFLPVRPGEGFVAALAAAIADGTGGRNDRMKEAVVALLQSPAYHLS